MSNAKLEGCRPAEHAAKVDRGGSNGTHIRFGLSSVLHLTGRVADRIISAYDSLLSMDEKETARIYFDMGTDYAHGGNGADALIALQRALELEPANGDAWFKLGMVHLDQHEPEAAVEAFGKAVALGKDTSTLHVRLAEAFADAGDYQAAAEDLKRAVELDPTAAESFFRLGVARDKLEDYEGAVKAFEKAVDLSPRESAYYQSLGFTMESLKRHEEAVTCFKRAVELQHRGSR